jgi:translation initiation factor 5B
MPVLVATDASSVAADLSAATDILEGEQHGVIIKADTIGSIEALVHLLGEKNIPFHRAGIGPVSKKDVAEAQAQPDPVVIAFNVPVQAGVDTSGIGLLQSNIIYHVLEQYAAREAQKQAHSAISIHPTKVELLKNHIFRQSNPLICGMHIAAGELATGMQLMKDGVVLATVKDIQENKESVGQATAGKAVAVSLVGPTAGRQCDEGDILYTALTEEQFRSLRAAAKHLTEAEKQTMREIAEIMRRSNPLWGV